jgi:hydroxypyruvate reductase
MGSRADPSDAPNLAPENGKVLARRILDATMAAIDVRHAMLARLRLEGQTLVVGGESLELPRPPYVVAIGKAANRMAATLDETLGGRIESGVVVSPAEPPQKLPRLWYFQGGHPYPNSSSLSGAEAAIELLTGLSEGAAVIYLISGGGSALFEKPLDARISLEDLIELNRLLVGCGLPIEQINVIRKHLSSVKGGRLAARAHPARQLTIYISDVPDDVPSMVASGPTMPDESTAEQCYSLVTNHGLAPKLPASIRKHFAEGSIVETPKPGDARFARSRYYCLLSNRDALEAAKGAAENLGFVAEIDSGNWDAHYRQVVDESLGRLAAARKRYAGKAVCLIQGGEVISPVTGSGMGGRNQAFALYAAGRIAESKRTVLSAGTDGRDGNSPAGGAVADGETLARARGLELDAEEYLKASNSYHFFRALGDTIETGYTDNNVRDVRLWLDFEQ